MKRHVKLLLGKIRRWHHDGPHADISVVPRPAMPLPPQITWVLLALIHYLKRKLWAWGMLVTKVVPEAGTYRAGGVTDSRVLERQASGILPGFQAWRYTLAGGNTSVSNEATGEFIHLDLYNGPEFIETDRFFTYIQQQRDVCVVAQRVRELLPDSGLVAATRLLQRCRVLTAHEVLDGDVLSLWLRDWVLKYSEAVQAFLAAWEKPENRGALASVIWDWSVLQAAVDSQDDVDLTARLAALDGQAKCCWLTLLRAELNHGDSESMLCALAAADEVSRPRPDNDPRSALSTRLR